MTADKDPHHDRKAAILESAASTFATYGFRRCSMEDIAAGAGVSRPSLYQHFRNKTEVFRAASEQLQSAAIDDAAAVTDGPLAPRLAAMLIAYKRPIWRIHVSTPHGRDMMDVNATIADDVTLAALARFNALLATALSPHLAAGWDAEALARLLSGAVWAIVEKAETEEAFCADITTLATIWAAAISVPKPR